MIMPLCNIMWLDNVHKDPDNNRCMKSSLATRKKDNF